jgi:hypothetical protein
LRVISSGPSTLKQGDGGQERVDFDANLDIRHGSCDLLPQDFFIHQRYGLSSLWYKHKTRKALIRPSQQEHGHEDSKGGVRECIRPVFRHWR